MKPVKPRIGAEGDYHIDALVENNTVLPAEVQTAIRNLLLACELGALVVVQCTRIQNNKRAFVLCAYAETPTGDDRLLPICELGTPIDMVAAFRPPSLTVRNGVRVAQPVFSDDLTDLVPVDEGVEVRAELVRDKDDSVH